MNETNSCDNLCVAMQPLLGDQAPSFLHFSSIIFLSSEYESETIHACREDQGSYFLNTSSSCKFWESLRVKRKRWLVKAGFVSRRSNSHTSYPRTTMNWWLLYRPRRAHLRLSAAFSRSPLSLPKWSAAIIAPFRSWYTLWPWARYHLAPERFKCSYRSSFFLV